MNNMFYIEGEPEIVSDTRKMILETFQDLEFYEDTHTYILNGLELLSASHIAHILMSSFNSESRFLPLYSRASFSTR